MTAELIYPPSHVQTPDAARAIDALRNKLSGFFQLGDDAAEALIGFCGNLRTFRPGQAIQREGEPYESVYFVADGWANRSRTLPDGGRQIVNVSMPGDVLCMNALMFRTSDFDITALTAMTVFPVRANHLRQLLGNEPDLAAALFWVTAHEECMLAERVVSLGRRSAKIRTAHVLAEMLARLSTIEDVPSTNVEIPLLQSDLADILGISLVHMNKTLRALENDGILAFRKGVLRLHDRRNLERLAGFDNGYLHFTVRT